MLRVNTEHQGNTCTVELYGRLADEWVDVLEQQWRELAPSETVRLVLSDVDFVDARGEQLLARMARAGVNLVASGCMNRHLLERLKAVKGHMGALSASSPEEA